ncbi:nuclear pore complex-interacting protein family member B3 [Piliocolobus tephrosceles]|uniref:nuclear pore complex-interacting protein family member B3 n=1 Tax=Piliocolobus tephrosceles TaxID=591936 RepID=UPI000C2B1E95|nr:nuclear pore complex-interacting protein family member B3 [Piliocolobus tephrosceles]
MPMLEPPLEVRPPAPRNQVVKLFIVLTPQFLSHDQGQLTKELQQHVKSVTYPCKYLRKVSECRQMGSGALEQSVTSSMRVHEEVNDGSTDLQQRAWRSNRHSQKVMLSIGVPTVWK